MSGKLYIVPTPVGNLDDMPPRAIEVLKNCKIEENLKDVKPGDTFQFMRTGYFCVDTDSTPENIVFNRTVALKDSWAKVNK